MNELTLEIPYEIPVDAQNPVEPFLRMDRMPHIWCPGCGIGTTVNCFAQALIESKIDLESLALVSGIGCTGRVGPRRSWPLPLTAIIPVYRHASGRSAALDSFCCLSFLVDLQSFQFFAPT